MSAIIKEYSIGHATASILMLAVALPAVFFSILGGGFVDRYGIKSLGSIGLILICLGGLLSGFSTSYTQLVIGRVVMGFGGSFALISTFALIAQLFSIKQRGFAMGVFGLNMPLATIISFNLLGRLESVYDWRSSLWIPLGVSVTAFFFWTFFIKVKRSSSEKIAFKFSGLRNRQIWLLGFIWAGFNMAAISFTTWGPKLFEDYWMIVSSYADFLASLLMVGALITPLTGYVSDKFGSHRVLIMISALGMTIALFLIPAFSGGTLFIVLVVFGIIAAFIPPATFALPPEVLDRSSVGLGYGVLNTCLNVGVIGGPLIVGVVIDLTHSVTAIFSTMAIFAILPLLIAFGLKTR
ncbi:MFS transporter [[Eubacterium] cellulosolvens]